MSIEVRNGFDFIKLFKIKKGGIVNSFDTIVLQMPEDCHKIIKKEAFLQNITADIETGEHDIKPILKDMEINKMIGVNNLKIDEKKNILLELSAKVLKERYAEGINRNTISQVFVNINEYKIIEFNIPRSIEKAIIRKRADIFYDYEITDSINIYLNEMRLVSNRNKYFPKKYGTGLFFETYFDSNHRKLKVYDKEVEYLLPRNELIRKYCPKEKFKNKMRIELSLKGLGKIREEFEVFSGDVRLITLLNSPKNVLYKHFNLVLTTDKLYTVPRDIFSPKVSINETLSELGRQKLLEETRYDLSTVKRILKSKSKGEPTSQLKRMSESKARHAAKVLHYDFARIKAIGKALSKL